MPMYNNTREDYKKAIKAKYEIEKEGEFSNYFLPTSQANLRKLCWERFKSNENKDDLATFNDFFGFVFDPTRANHFREQTDRFRSIISFLKGRKQPASFSSVEIGAILVDFQPRPYKKFKDKGVFILEEPVKNPNLPEAIFLKPENQTKEENDVKQENLQMEIEPKSFFLNFKSNFFDKLIKRSKSTIIAISTIFCLIAVVIYFAFFKKDCMQWSDDHYEIVDCTSEVTGRSNKIIPLDENVMDLRKVVIYDTTNCFKKNGKPFIWYSKFKNEVDFYNMDGENPENGRALSPVTQYMVTKYGKKK